MARDIAALLGVFYCSIISNLSQLCGSMLCSVIDRIDEIVSRLVGLLRYRTTLLTSRKFEPTHTPILVVSSLLV